MTELKPCPFCGGTYVIDASQYDDASDDWYYLIICEDCAAGGPHAESPVEALDAWDRRVPPPPPAAEQQNDDAADGVGG